MSDFRLGKNEIVEKFERRSADGLRKVFRNNSQEKLEAGQRHDQEELEAGRRHNQANEAIRGAYKRKFAAVENTPTAPEESEEEEDYE